MRPIKFRAWRRETESMLDSNQSMANIISRHIAWWTIWGTAVTYSDQKDSNSSEYDIMQSTWLTDKNWKEIFEWDIVIGIKWDERAPRYEVYFDEEILAYFIRNSKTNFHLCDLREIEIIWNLYENPELLSKI